MLRSPSAGKLLQYTVDDGGHVAEGSVFAEIEVSSCSSATWLKVKAAVGDGFAHPGAGDEDHHDADGGGGGQGALRQAAGCAAGGRLCHCTARAG